MRSARIAQKSPTRKDARPAKARGKAPLRQEIALAMADALVDILQYEDRLRSRASR
jgi:hypothetical protein